jgi:hypothetical protein
MKEIYEEEKKYLTKKINSKGVSPEKPYKKNEKSVNNEIKLKF